MNDLRGFWDIVIRYIIILFAGLGNLYIFYAVLTPLTLVMVGFVLKLFSEVVTLTDGFIVNGVNFNLVPACIGGSAFYLLFVLLMSCRGIEVVKRIKIFLFSFALLYAFNIFRIILMVKIYGAFYFDLAHWIIWYFVSTLFVVMIWFFVVRLFEIKSIPVYSDFKFIIASFEKGGNGRRKKKSVRAKKKVEGQKR